MTHALAGWELMGRRVFDVHGEPLGTVMDTHPPDGGWDASLVLVHVGNRFPRRRWVPIDGARTLGHGLFLKWSRTAIEDGPDAEDNRWAHPADMARAYYITAD